MFAIAGESLVDLVREPDGRYLAAPGGGPFNFARAMALQGIGSAYLNPISDDPSGQMLLSTLESAGAVHLGRRVRAPTSLALVATDARGENVYSFYRSGIADRETGETDLAARMPEHATGFHTGGLALVPPDAGTAIGLLASMRRRGLLCTLDLNVRPAVTTAMGIPLDAYRDAVLEAARHAHVVKLSDEDLAHLDLTGDVPSAAASFLARGASLVVLTLGRGGSMAIARGLRVLQGAFAVPVVDTVGAGDCFFAGFVAHLYHADALNAVIEGSVPQDQLSSALLHATACAAIDLQRRGCQPPTRDDALSLLGQAPETFPA